MFVNPPHLKWPLFISTMRKDEADYYAGLLRSASIQFWMDAPQTSFNAVTGQAIEDIQYFIRVPEDQVFKANNILDEDMEKNIIIETDYYLHDYSDNALADIINNRNDWSRFDFIAAKKILAERMLN